MVIMGYQIKELVYCIINIINKIIEMHNNFDLTFLTLTNFLKGKTNKAIEVYKLDQLPWYGLIEEKYHNRVTPLLKEMKNQGIIDINEEKYGIVKVLNPQPDDETLMAVFSGIIPKDR